MILERVDTAIAEYNRSELHYNLVADAIYRARETTDPFSSEYEPYIIAELIAFDMERTMGAGCKYEVAGTGVGRLHRMHDGRKVVQVYDYIDTQVPMLARLFEKRLKGYRTIGYEMQSKSADASSGLSDI